MRTHTQRFLRASGIFPTRQPLKLGKFLSSPVLLECRGSLSPRTARASPRLWGCAPAAGPAGPSLSSLEVSGLSRPAPRAAGVIPSACLPELLGFSHPLPGAVPSPLGCSPRTPRVPGHPPHPRCPTRRSGRWRSRARRRRSPLSPQPARAGCPGRSPQVAERVVEQQQVDGGAQSREAPEEQQHQRVAAEAPAAHAAQAHGGRQPPRGAKAPLGLVPAIPAGGGGAGPWHPRSGIATSVSRLRHSLPGRRRLRAPPSVPRPGRHRRARHTWDGLETPRARQDCGARCGGGGAAPKLRVSVNAGQNRSAGCVQAPLSDV